mmetsp:Transcript_74677/g.148415  ORF Transcript_74677/g.148415 Transcript_74677/m.148415 type:complete len:228 (-) Transcript_74677:254-937(-)
MGRDTRGESSKPRLVSSASRLQLHRFGHAHIVLERAELLRALRRRAHSAEGLGGVGAAWPCAAILVLGGRQPWPFGRRGLIQCRRSTRGCCCAHGRRLSLDRSSPGQVIVAYLAHGAQVDMPLFIDVDAWLIRLPRCLQASGHRKGKGLPLGAHLPRPLRRRRCRWHSRMCLADDKHGSIPSLLIERNQVTMREAARSIRLSKPCPGTSAAPSNPRLICSERLDGQR